MGHLQSSGMKGLGSEGIAVSVLAIALLGLCWMIGFNLGAENFGEASNVGKYRVLFVHKSYFGTDVLMLESTKKSDNVIIAVAEKSKNGKSFYAQPGDMVCLTRMKTIMPCGSFMASILS